jgi:hypothetical protein
VSDAPSFHYREGKMTPEYIKQIMEKVGPMSPYSDISIPSIELFELCQDALKAHGYVHRQSGSFDGQACAAAMRAYFSTDSGRTSIEVQPVSNPYLRNRIEAAFIAGWDAAAQRCELQPSEGGKS